MNTDSRNLVCVKPVWRVLVTLFLIICAAFATAARASESVIWSEDFEGGFPPDWSVTSGTWEVGQPTNGVVVLRGDSSRCAATIVNGNYVDGLNTRLETHLFTVPAASEFPRLRFWHWFAFNDGDYGEVQIKVGTTDWVSLATFEGTAGGVWTRPSVDLRAYAAKTVRLGFGFHSKNIDHGFGETTQEVGPGWYLDDVAVATGTPGLPNPEGFEAGWGDWAVDGGIWEIGRPTSGPGNAHSGNNVAATVLAANYPDAFGSVNGADSRLISPEFVVPEASQFPRLRFWHWFAFNDGDYGKVQVRVEGSATWIDVGGPFSGNGANWSPPPSIDLSPYEGQRIHVAFTFHSKNIDHGFGETTQEVGPGWYLDDVCVAAGTLSARLTIPRGASGSSLTITTNEGSLLTFTANATGTNTQSDLRYNLGQHPPEGASIDPVTGAFSWIPSEAQGPQNYVIPVNIMDNGNRGWIACTFVTITVGEVNEAPILTEPDHTIGEGQAALWTLCGTDKDFPPNSLSYVKLSGPKNITVADSGRVTWTPAQLGSYPVTVRVTDQSPAASNNKQLSTTNTFTVTVVPTNTLYFYSLSIETMSLGQLQFTINDGRVGSNYVLQTAPTLLDCPPSDHWRDLTNILAGPMPFTFGYVIPDFGAATNRFYRLRTE